ncbi:sporulation protein [Tumebacillus permanentifrigoris]|uniref:Sporulation-control protein n=1 Tax=Tumebacillus permanentifrigoris TaxID=378543 RepID=A0A316D8N6_9BACL|nr:sporulation protein [Tumebacillus permanentifrigoris]PWK11303.1 sporulation-control protein [Tumebacillus permanentifrigoris]
MFKNLFHKLGVSSATVNLVLDSDRVRVGEEVVGAVLITGGKTETQIDAVNVHLTMKNKQGDEERTYEIAKINVATGLVVREGESLQFPLRYTLPVLPQSSHYVSFTLHTELDIPGAVDKHDFDNFYVLPAQPIAVIQETLYHLGFEPKADSGELEGHHQKFEYKPTRGAYRGRLTELEAIFLLEDEGVRIYVELDHRSGLFGQEVETTPTVFIGYEHLNSVESCKAVFIDFLEQEIRHFRG